MRSVLSELVHPAVRTIRPRTFRAGILAATVRAKIQWVCDTCGARAETRVDLPCDSLDKLTINEAATTLLDALRSVPHPHAVRATVEMPPS